MKKRLLLIAVASTAYFGVNAQTIVTSNPQFRSAVLEELTGLHCQYCPDGHVIADNMKAANPNRVVLINIHTGGYATPGAGEPDMRTPDGDDIGSLAAPAGYPAGSINRNIFPASDNNTAMGRGGWSAAADEVMLESTPVNVGATTSYNSGTRDLTIDVEAFYTANAISANNYLHIALLQDSILGPQTGGTTYNPGNYVGGQYVHSKVLRDMITGTNGTWGDTIFNTTQGSLYAKQFVYNIPTTIAGEPVDDNNLKLAIFVTDTREHIYTGIELGIDGAANDGTTLTYYGSLSNLNANVMEGTVSDTSNFTVDFDLSLTVPVDFVFELSSDAPGDWNGYYSVNGTDYAANDTVTLNNGVTANIGIGVIPGATGAVSKYTLTMYPENDPSSIITQDVYVISGITDLVVNGTGNWGDGGSYNWESLYTDGLNYAGNTSYDATSGFVFKEAESNNALNNVNNIYLNIGWTFPSFADDEASAIMSFMNNGGNVFVAGQDIGWDIMSGSGYGTGTTVNLFINFLHANYVADGTSASNQLIANTGDAVFGTVGNSTIVDVYGGNMYPDEINPGTGAINIFDYNGNKSGGVRYLNATYKVVYMGIGMEMIQNLSTKDDILKWSHDWFYGLVSTQEFDDFANAGMSIFPNPNQGVFTVNIKTEGVYNLSVINLLGEQVYSSQINNASVTNHNIDLSNISAGVYLVRLSDDKNVTTKKIIIE